MKSAVSLALVILAGLLHLGVRLYDVQVRGAADYSYASARQSIRRVQVAGVRGRIRREGDSGHGLPVQRRKESDFRQICRR